MKSLHIAALGMLALGVAMTAIGAEDEKYPTIHHAISTLEQTRDDLKNGEHGFGGHRSKAIEHIDAAITELHEALEFADAHPESIKAPEK